MNIQPAAMAGSRRAMAANVATVVAVGTAAVEMAAAEISNRLVIGATMLRQTVLLVATVVALVDNVSAKGPTVRLVITGGGLTAPITVTDERVLSVSGVFNGAFLGGIADSNAIDPTWPRHMVSFFVELPAWMRQGVQKKYVVFYVKHPRTGQGFVYLPAPGEEWYRFNTSTIVRNGLEGNWLHASKAWARALNTHLP